MNRHVFSNDDSSNNESPHAQADRQIDRWVVDWLDQEASELDVKSLQAKILSATPSTPAKSPRKTTRTAVKSRHYKRWLAIAALAASLLLTITLVSQQFQQPVSASVLVTEAYEMHRLHVERRYRVTTTGGHREDAFAQNSNELVEVAVLGDRFRVEVNRGPRQWVWGRESNGNIWMVLGPRAAVVFEADEVGPQLNRMAEIHSLELESLLQELPRGFELKQTQSADLLTHTIVARPRSGRNHSMLQQATVVIDAESKIVKELILERQPAEGQKMTTTFTLIESIEPDESKFSPAGHLERFHRVIDADIPLARREEMLTNRFGRMAERWIRKP